MTRYVTLTGLSGNKYQYEAYDVNSTWNPVPGNYVFAALIKPTILTERWEPIYIGETGNFANRLPSHEKWVEARLKGATHILAHVNREGIEARQAEERDLVRAYNPPLNIEYSPPLGLLAGQAPGIFGLGLASRRGKK